jgi:N,N'-diacetylchitobiose transport system permease protein
MHVVEPSTRRRTGPDPGLPQPALGRKRRRQRQVMPYVLALPTLIVLGALLAYPLVKMIILSVQQLTLRDLFTGETPQFVGFGNYTAILRDGFFWTVVLRTVLVAAICVVASVGGGMLVAQLMRRVSPWVRITMLVAMMLVWAMPQLVATQIFAWLVDTDWGVVNWLIDKVPGVNFSNHSWWVDPVQGWSVIIALVVWGAVPFVAINFYAGLTQVPKELVEAAVVDGASSWAVFRRITLPIIQPLVVIVTTLSVIWDMGIFTQVYVIRASKPELDYYNLAIYSYQEAFTKSHYSQGSAISIITVLLMIGVMAFYVRQVFKIGDAD